VYEATLDNGALLIRVELPLVPAGPKPVVISPIGDPEPYLAAGLGVATYRINWNGGKVSVPRPGPPPAKTYGVWLLASPTRERIGQAYFDIIEGTAARVPAVVDYLSGLAEVDPSRLAIMGSSTHGFVALEAIAREPRLTAGIVFATCGDYPCFLHRSSLAMKGEPLALDPAYEVTLRAREAMSHPERLTHAALLMVNGAKDLAVPAPCAIATARALADAYRRAGVPDRFEFVLVEGAGHGDLWPVGMKETHAWIARWLAPDARATPTDAAGR
jgi:dienelactone hydrolase